MTFNFFALGKTNEPYVSEGVQIFTKRIGNYFPVSWKIIPPVKNAASLTEADLKKKEGEAILSSLANSDYLILLDERGDTLSSVQLASFLQSKANEGTKSVVFLIGGAFGVSPEVMKRANFTWSVSSLTFPHQLVRLILAEQVYRACSIMRNEKYHHT